MPEPGIEFLYVVYEVGRGLQVRIGFEAYVLEAGDSISIDSTTPHRLANLGRARSP